MSKFYFTLGTRDRSLLTCKNYEPGGGFVGKTGIREASGICTTLKLRDHVFFSLKNFLV